jgi:hypothetical protein
MDKAKGTKRIIEVAHWAAEAYAKGDTEYAIQLERSIANLGYMYRIDPAPLVGPIMSVRTFI